MFVLLLGLLQLPFGPHLLIHTIRVLIANLYFDVRRLHFSSTTPKTFYHLVQVVLLSKSQREDARIFEEEFFGPRISVFGGLSDANTGDLPHPHRTSETKMSGPRSVCKLIYDESSDMYITVPIDSD